MPERQATLVIKLEVEFVDHLVSPRRKPGATYAGLLRQGWKCRITALSVNGETRINGASWIEQDSKRPQGVRETERDHYKFQHTHTKSFEFSFWMKVGPSGQVLAPFGPDMRVLFAKPKQTNENAGIRDTVFKIITEVCGQDWMIESESDVFLSRYRLKRVPGYKPRLVIEADGMASSIFFEIDLKSLEPLRDPSGQKVASMMMFEYGWPKRVQDVVYPTDLEWAWINVDGTFKDEAIKQRFYDSLSQYKRVDDVAFFQELTTRFHNPVMRRSAPELSWLLAEDFSRSHERRPEPWKGGISGWGD